MSNEEHGDVYSVDSIAPAPEDSEFPHHSLVRLVHYVERGAGAPEYLLASKDTIVPDVVPDASEDEGTKFAHGRAFSIVGKGLGSLRRRVRFPSGRAAVSVVDADHIEQVLRRNVPIEVLLSREISRAFETARPMSTPLAEPQSKGSSVLGYARIRVFDVGQGDGILLLLPNGEAWLVDAYFPGAKTVDHLLGEIQRAAGEVRIKRLVISHFHHDHIQKAEYLVKKLRPDAVVVPRSLKHTTAGTRNLLRICSRREVLEYLDNSIRWDVGQGIKVTIVPTASVRSNVPLGKDPNNHALVIGITGPDVWRTALLSGDVSGPLLNDTLSALGPLLTGDGTQAGSPCGIGFYKVTHHCSETGGWRALLDNLDPDWAATSCARHNKFGHPYQPLKEKLDAITRKHNGGHLLTYEHGDIIYPDESSIPHLPITQESGADAPRNWRLDIPPQVAVSRTGASPEQPKLKAAGEVIPGLLGSWLEVKPRLAAARAACTRPA